MRFRSSSRIIFGPKSVVQEFGVQIEFRRDRDVSPVVPIQTYSSSRYGERVTLTESAPRQD